MKQTIKNASKLPTYTIQLFSNEEFYINNLSPVRLQVASNSSFERQRRQRQIKVSCREILQTMRHYIGVLMTSISGQSLTFTLNSQQKCLLSCFTLPNPYILFLYLFSLEKKKHSSKYRCENLCNF